MRARIRPSRSDCRCRCARAPAAQSQWPAFEAKLRAKGLGDAAVAAFKLNYDQLVAGVDGLVRVGQAHARANVRCAAGCWHLRRCHSGAPPPGRRPHLRAARGVPPTRSIPAQVSEAEIEPVASLPELRSLPAAGGDVAVRACVRRARERSAGVCVRSVLLLGAPCGVWARALAAARRASRHAARARHLPPSPRRCCARRRC